MADEDSEKRIRSVMDKLFPSPKSKALTRNCKSSEGTKRGNSVTNMLISESSNSGRNVVASRGLKRSTVTVGSSSSETPLCRPWDRGDVMRRLSTFKSMTWFAKPKVVSAVNCARRGWINVEMDIIACEACGARLLFSTPPSWTQHQIEKAAAVFSLKLEDGHKMLCPWVNNASDEKTAQFPPTPGPALVDSYKKRSFALLQLSALPVISSTTIDHMRSPQLVHFLENSSMLGFGHGTIQTGRSDYLGNEHEAVSANLYHQAQKLISLCGWEPRSLPYMVDCGNLSTQSKGGHSKDLSSQVINGQNAGTILHSTSGTDEAMKANDDHSSQLRLSNPASTVLDCRLCGASVGLWAFSTVPRPLELIRLVESSESGGETSVIGCINRTSGTDCSVNENHFDHNGGSMGTAMPLSERHLDLNFSIAGGPPPAKQNYRARVSLPIISRYLRTGLSSNFNIKGPNVHNMLYTGHFIPSSDLPNTNSLQQKKDCRTPCTQIIQSEDMRNTTLQRNEIEPFFLRDDELSCLNCASNEEDALKSDKKKDMPMEGGSSSELGVPSEQAVGIFTDASTENQMESTDEMPQVQGRVGDTLTSQDNSMMVSTEVFPQQLDKDSSGYDMIHECTSEARDYVSSCVTSCLEMNTTVEIACKMDALNADEGFNFEKSSNVQGTNQEANRAMPTVQPTGSNANGRVGDTLTSQDNADEGFDFEKSSNVQGTNQEAKGVVPTVQPAVNNETAAAQGLGKDLQVQSDQVMAFDPIAQHRHFCPWIESNGSAACGWQLTLSALDHERDSSHLLVRESLDSSSLEVDDPIASVRKLFRSPPLKRKKTSNAST